MEGKHITNHKIEVSRLQVIGKVLNTLKNLQLDDDGTRGISIEQDRWPSPKMLADKGCSLREVHVFFWRCHES